MNVTGVGTESELNNDGEKGNPAGDEIEQDRLKLWLEQGRERQFREQVTQGTRLLHERKPEEALPLLKRAHEIRPTDVDASLNLASAYILLGRYKLAVPVLEEAVKQTPSIAQLWINLGAAYLGNPILSTDEHQLKAIGAFQRALQVDPFAPSAAYNIGLIHVDRGERDKAIAAFRLAAKSDPGDLDAKRLLKKLEA
jgi:tetratricopeptide (TPR) repeat protein